MLCITLNAQCEVMSRYFAAQMIWWFSAGRLQNGFQTRARGLRMRFFCGRRCGQKVALGPRDLSAETICHTICVHGKWVTLRLLHGNAGVRIGKRSPFSLAGTHSVGCNISLYRVEHSYRQGWHISLYQLLKSPSRLAGHLRLDANFTESGWKALLARQYVVWCTLCRFRILPKNLLDRRQEDFLRYFLSFQGEFLGSISARSSAAVSGMGSNSGREHLTYKRCPLE